MTSGMKLLIPGLLAATACSKSAQTSQTPVPSPAPAATAPAPVASRPAPAPARATARANSDPRVGLKAGMTDAGEAVSNLKVDAKVPSPPGFAGITNADIAFTGNYAVQGNYNGAQIWDVSNPSAPTIVSTVTCPASQNDVSVYKQQLLFMSAEAPNARLDCGKQGFGPADSVSKDRIRGVRIFDITDIRNPKYITSVQTCRGSHTHTLVEDPKDPNNVYLYISGSSPVRSPNEMSTCVRATPDKDPKSSLFQIEVIKVPLAHPEQAAIINGARIFQNLAPAPSHGEGPDDRAALERARASGAFLIKIGSEEMVLPSDFAQGMLDSTVRARNGTGPATKADSAALRAALPGIVAALIGADGPPTGPNQCHDITVYPSLGLAGGACGGYGLLLDIRDPVNPKRIDAVADSNFAYWHSATFNNDGTKLLFSDEWGGGGSPKCRATDPKEWGADAIFTIDTYKLKFQIYYKIAAPQTEFENCVAHNGSLIPIPDRDVMVQAWYQGGISVFDWTDAAHPKEIAYFDRGPIDSTHMAMGGSWSVYWYNGVIVSSEIARGLDVFELTPSGFLTQNEIDAAKSVHLDYLNTQGQPHFTWPNTFALARAYVDQLARSNGLASGRIAKIRDELKEAEKASGAKRTDELNEVAKMLDSDAGSSSDAAKVRLLAATVRGL
jgi:hypothetical protein